MKLKILIISLLLAALFSCEKGEIIPQEDMVRIYRDMYLLDQSLSKNRNCSRIADTLMIYRPIFERYGYDSEDYAVSVKYYLERPEKFGKLFLEVKELFRHRLDFINDSIAREEHRLDRWNLADSLRALGHDSILTTRYYRALDMLFFEKDTMFRQEYLRADSAVLASYKLTPFELYEGNPFELYPFSHKALVIVADTGAAEVSVPKERNKVINREKSPAKHQE